jgi:hypothetical protein
MLEEIATIVTPDATDYESLEATPTLQPSFKKSLFHGVSA